MPKMNGRIYPDANDPSRDPMRAPTPKGLHPHMLRSGVERRGEQDGYEGLNQVRTQLSQADQQSIVLSPAVSGAPATSLLDFMGQHPLLVGAAILGAAWGLAKVLDKEPRQNPSQALTPIVMMPMAAPGAQTMSKPELEAKVVEEVKKPKKVRRTTQARDSSGRYLTQNTRARAITEGKKCIS